MNPEEKIRKLETMPWQALFDLAVKYQVEEEELKGKEKDEVIRRLLLTDISEEEINKVVDNYIYGNRVTFTLWGFSENLNKEDLDTLKNLEGKCVGWIEVKGFRNLQYISVKECQDRLEILYSYSKEYTYTNENGHADSIWEMHQSCFWVGTEKNYLASISKHEKMMLCVIQLLSEKLGKRISQINMPKKAIERCVNSQEMSRIVLQGTRGEKTTISNSSGFTDEQKQEMEMIRGERFDTSGSYIAEITDGTNATVKYNFNKANIGIYKQLPSEILFEWSKKAIEIILEEIENLKGKPATEIFQEMGVEIKWPGHAGNASKLNWFLTQVIASLDGNQEFRITIPEEIRDILQVERLFIKLPRVYCNECDSYEIPYCANCGEPLTYNRKGALECSCDAPLRVTCAENHHSCEIRPWYVPQKVFLDMVNRNVQKVYKDYVLEYRMCIMGDELCIVRLNPETKSEVEVLFSDIENFKSTIIPDTAVRAFAVRMNEKCEGTCSKAKIDKCVNDATMNCLPKIFYDILPTYRPQPHKGGEFGDVSGPVRIGAYCYQMIGILKKNSENKAQRNGKTRTDDELIQEPLLSSSKTGEEIIRQFVEQGMSDARVEVIAVVAPQYFDRSLRGTLCMLAKLAGKKIVFIGLDEVCQLIAMNDKVKVV